MPKYKKSYKKKTLSKSNIFKNKSAKAQAKQIYGINKKIKYIQKVTSPEIQRLQDNLVEKNFVDNTLRPIVHFNSVLPLYKDYLLNADRSRHITIQGNILRVRYIQLYGYFGCIQDATMSGPWQQNESADLITTHPFTAYLRIIVCRLKKSCQAIPLRITQAPDEVIPESENYYDVKPINGPLISDLTSQLSVIKDKVIKINNTTPGKLYKIKLSPKKLGFIYRKPPAGSNAATVGENELAIYYQYVCPNVFDYKNLSQTRLNIGPVCRFTMNINYGYLDQN